MKIYLVRHGQTDWNYQKKIQGQQDVDINEQGIRQAEKLAEILKNVPFEYAVCSPLTRAHHTAEILLKYHSVPLSYDERLKEIYLGKWEGKTHKEVMTQEKNPVWQYFHCPENYHPDGDMESLEKLYRRGEAFVREVLFPLEDHYETILVVAHGGLIRTILNPIVGYSVHDFWKLTLENCSTEILECKDRQLTLSKKTEEIA